MNYNPASLFGVVNIPGVGFVQGTGAGQPRGRGLGDESAVMMISGLSNACVTLPDGTVDCGTPYGPPPKPGILGTKAPGAQQAPRAPATGDVLNVPVTLFNVTLPLWAWLAIAALLGGAGGAALMHFKMKR